MALRFNCPPGWPPPPEGWFPTADWSPDPSWPPAPPAWQLVVLEGAAASPAYGISDGASSQRERATSSPPHAAEIEPATTAEPAAGSTVPPTSKSAPVVVGSVVPTRTSSGQNYDATLLPRGFWDRGFDDHDFAWWLQHVRAAVNVKDVPLLTALIRGEVARLSEGADKLTHGLEKARRGDQYELAHMMPRINGAIEQVKTYMERVQHAASPFLRD